MKLSLPKSYTSRITRAIAEFDLIEEGDKVLIGFSGGKDSAFLLYALAVLQENMAIDFEIAALTVDLGFAGPGYVEEMREYCNRLGVAYEIKETKISEIILDEDSKNPCAKCAYFRKGAIAKYMKEHGFNKIAYGHHYDDAVETFLMSIIYSGQIKTFEPKSYLSNSDIHVIRPLIYLREAEIIKAAAITNYESIESPCPYDGETTRQEIKELLKTFNDQKQVFYNVAAAMREDSPQLLWPKELKKEELRDKSSYLWNKE